MHDYRKHTIDPSARGGGDGIAFRIAGEPVVGALGVTADRRTRHEEVSMRLEGKVAIVTGGGAGFGEGICRRFAAEGARVIVNDVNEQDGRHVADAIGEAGGEAGFVYADVSRDDDTGRLVAEAVDRYGRLDIMVNNAGVPQRAQPMENVTEDEFDRIFTVNVKALYWSAKHTVPLMRDAGGGCIIHTASTAAISPRPGLVWYNGSKGAVNTITQGMAVELAPHRIRVNAVCAGGGETRCSRSFSAARSHPRCRPFIEPGPVAG